MIKKIIILKPKRSLNFSESCNAGVVNSKSGMIFIANDDIIISENTMEKLYDNTDDQTVTGPDSNCNLGFQSDYAYTVGGVRLIPSMTLEQIKHIIPDIYKIKPIRHDNVERDWLAFFATMFTRKCFDNVGLMDENFIYDREDLQWCLESRKKGIKFKTVFSSYCFHFGGVSRKRKHQELGLKHDEDQKLNLYYFNAKNGIRRTKPIEGFEGYTVSEDGIVISNKIWRGTTERLLALRTKEDGYVTAHLSENSILSNESVHRLVAKAFIPNPENLPEVNHRNGIKDDNRIENLEWVSSSENQKHAYATGLCEGKGNHASHTLTEEEVIFLRKIYKNCNISMISLGELFNISKSNACRIVNEEDWSKEVQDKLTIGLYCWDAFEYWDENSLNKSIDPSKPSGIGGSETQIVLLARELALLNYKVKIFNKCKNKHYDLGYDIEYIPFDFFPEYSKSAYFDYFVASRYLQCFDYSFKYGKAFAMIHDVFLILGNKAQSDVHLDKIDKYFCLSEEHKKFVSQHHSIPMDKIVVTSNGLDMDRFKNKVEKDPFKMIYSSSPDRGLELLLDLFPKVKSEIPEATLDIYYGFENFRDQVYVKKMFDKINATEGVSYKGRIGQDELAKKFLEASIWAYPTWFEETFGITALEAMAGGAVPVTSSYWGLIDTLGDAGITLPMPIGKLSVHQPEYQDAWISSCIKLLKDKDYFLDEQAKCLDRVKKFSWAAVSSQWDQYFRKGIWSNIQKTLI